MNSEQNDLPATWQQFCDETDEVDAIRNSRRELMESQLACEIVKSDIHNKINKSKPANAIFEDLKKYNKPLYDYIKFLENINSRIWCNKCNTRKTVDFIDSESAQCPRADFIKDISEITSSIENVTERIKKINMLLKSRETI